MVKCFKSFYFSCQATALLLFLTLLGVNLDLTNYVRAPNKPINDIIIHFAQIRPKTLETGLLRPGPALKSPHQPADFRGQSFFCVATPTLRNSTPGNISKATSVEAFRKKKKHFKLICITRPESLFECCYYCLNLCAVFDLFAPFSSSVKRSLVP